MPDEKEAILDEMTEDSRCFFDGLAHRRREKGLQHNAVSVSGSGTSLRIDFGLKTKIVPFLPGV